MKDQVSATDSVLLSMSDAVRATRYSATYLRELASVGRLPCTRTTRGQYLFRLSDLKAFERAQAAKYLRKKSAAPAL